MLKFNESIDSVILFAFKGGYIVFFCFQSDIFFLSRPLSAWLFSALLYEKRMKKRLKVLFLQIKLRYLQHLLIILAS